MSLSFCKNTVPAMVVFFLDSERVFREYLQDKNGYNISVRQVRNFNNILKK